MANTVTITQSGVIAVNTDLWTEDAHRDKTAAFSLHVVSLGSSATLAMQGSLDGVNWLTAQMDREQSTPSTSISTGILHFTNCLFRHYRLRVTAAPTAGTTTVVITTYSREELNTLGLSRFSTVTNGVSSTAPGLYVQPYNVIRDDITSAAITSTSTSSSIDIANNGDTGVICVSNSSVGGTSPTMDVVVQESIDSGTNWIDVYHFPRMTTNGTWTSPLLRFNGNRLRYVRTISGTSPTFTCVVRRINHSLATGTPCRRIFSRSIVFNTLNSVTQTLETGEWGDGIRVTAVMGTATTAPVLAIEGSEDNSNWFQVGTDLTPVASTTVSQLITGTCPPFVRVRVKTAGVSAVTGYVSIRST